MDVTYRNCKLTPLFTRTFTREADLSDDRTTFQTQKVTLDCDCVYNPFATSFGTQNNVVGVSGAASPGFQPPQTDAAIRQTLLQPQGVLILSDEDGRPILRSPATGYTTDAKNGPTPEIVEVYAVHGTKSWRVRFRIVTWVNECADIRGGAAAPKKNILLSHRWKRYVDIDDDYFATVVTDGACVFRADELIRLGFFPDQYRQQLFHAIPKNFKRSHIHVAPSEDGTMVIYRVTDTETAFNFNDPNSTGGTRVEAFQTGGHFDPNTSAAIQEAAIGAVPALIQASLGGGAQGALTLARNLLPSYSMHVVCRAWGNRNSSRRQLQNTAMGICLARLQNQANVFSKSTETIISHELTGKWVECQITTRWGPEQLAANAGNLLLDIASFGGAQMLAQLNGVFGAAGVAPAFTGLASILSYFPTDEIISLGPNQVLAQANLVNPPPPFSGGTRGTWIGQLVAQALSAPCELPPRPPIKGGNFGLGNVDTPTTDRTIYN